MKFPTHLFLSTVFAFLILCPSCATTTTPVSTTSTNQVQSRQLIKSTQSWDGHDLPAYAAGQPEITILRIAIPPGAKLPRHHHPVINAGVLLQGELTVVKADGQTLTLHAGDPIIEVVNTLHHGLNSGDTTAEIIVFYAGTKDAPITVRDAK